MKMVGKKGTENEEISHCWGWDFLVARIYIIDLYSVRASVILEIS